MKKLAKLITVVILLIALLAGCSNAEQTPQNKNSITILQGVDATTLDPAKHSDSPTSNIEYQIFDTLLARDNNMKIQARVAKSWQMINDTTWQFELRDDIQFHNGIVLTAEDVKYSIERILNPNNKSAKISNYKSIKKIEVLNDNQLVISTHKPNPVLLTRLAELRIVPKSYVEEIGSEKFALNPVGSGPYKFNKWVKDDHISLTANEQYWNGSPAIQEVIFKPVPEASARVMALQSGDADLITNLPPHLIDTVNNNKNLQALKVNSTRFIMLSFTTSRESVKDVNVRKAINYAIDQDSIIKKILANNAVSSTQPVCNFDLGFNENIKGYEYNPQLAKELLAESGTKNLKIRMKSPSGRYLMDKEVAEAIKAQLQEVGIEVELTFEEWGSYVTSIIKGTIDADLWLIGWGSSTFDAGTTLQTFLHTSQPVAQYDVSETKNKWVDDQIDLALSTMNNDDRENIYHELIQQALADAPFVNLYQQCDIYGINTRINYTARSDELIDLAAVTFKKN